MDLRRRLQLLHLEEKVKGPLLVQRLLFKPQRKSCSRWDPCSLSDGSAWAGFGRSAADPSLRLAPDEVTAGAGRSDHMLHKKCVRVLIPGSQALRNSFAKGPQSVAAMEVKSWAETWRSSRKFLLVCVHKHTWHHTHGVCTV
ncbi:uncharacterized protein V6R79_018681 [Siganus canaliculatus]